MPAVAQAPCVHILHDESSDPAKGSINAIYLANLMGHWPRYEVRVRPVSDYKAGDADRCKATFYLGTRAQTKVPEPFLKDFFAASSSIAWVGFGQAALDPDLFVRTFGHRVAGELGVDDENADYPAYYEYVLYKGSQFVRDSVISENAWNADFQATAFMPAKDSADLAARSKLAELVHNRSGERRPYILRNGRKFVVADIPFAYMHEGGRYFVFADLMFDILDETPRRKEKLAFTRIEDIHGYYELDLLAAAFDVLKSEGVPVSLAHIPFFMDPEGTQGYGAVTTPVASTAKKEFAAMLRNLATDPRNAIIWHGVTHQLDNNRNPGSGASGDDYEFWDMVNDRPVADDTVSWTVNRLATALPVFDELQVAPRYWVTPHYQGSAVSNRVFGAVFPWVIGRVTYYPTSVGPQFTLPPASFEAATAMPAVNRGALEATKQKLGTLSDKSSDGLGQLFPFEIYRDVYGQRIIPETLGYLSVSSSETAVRDVANILADAQRNLVIRDYWASFFFHPYLFASVADGGSGRYYGDARRLRQIVIGLKSMGYRFTGLPEFEASLKNDLRN